MAQVFNVRVYGILLNAAGEVLLSDEQYGSYAFTKFPGGGMEYGEGSLDCLKRELKEELGLEATHCSHFYTTDFFQKSIMDDSQIISIYYLVQLAEGQQIPEKSDTGTLRFYAVDAALEARLSLPIDKVAARMLWEQRK